MIRACCFDMDGVLFDTERYGEMLMARAAAVQGFRLETSEWNSLIGTSMQETHEALAAWMPGLDPIRLMDDWKEITIRWAREEGLPLKRGARELIRWLRERQIPLAICTSNDRDVVQTYLEQAGWAEDFDTVVTAADVPRAKPAPDIYAEAVRRLGAAPGEALGVEDSPAGVRAIRAAGLRCVMVPDLVPFREELRPFVDHLLPDLHALRRMLEEEKA